MENTKNTKDILGDFLNSETYKKHDALLSKRREKIKHGDNIIHLQHLGEFSDNELQEINEKLLIANLELSSYDESADYKAQLETFDLITYFVLHSQLTKLILQSVGTSAIWEAIKWSIIFGWKKLRNETYTKLTSRTQEEKKLVFGFKAKLDKHSEFNFEMEGDLDKETIETSLDKALELLREMKTPQTIKEKNYLRYSTSENKWKDINSTNES